MVFSVDGIMVTWYADNNSNDDDVVTNDEDDTDANISRNEVRFALNQVLFKFQYFLGRRRNPAAIQAVSIQIFFT